MVSQKTKALSFLLSALVLSALAAGGFWLLQETKPETCPICERSIHAHSSAVVMIDKKRVTVCCIRCGITHNFQVDKPGEVVEVTEFLSDRAIKPKGAFYVEGSRVSMCDPHEGLCSIRRNTRTTGFSIVANPVRMLLASAKTRETLFKSMGENS